MALKVARELEKNNERDISALNSKVQMISNNIQSKNEQINGTILSFTF